MDRDKLISLLREAESIIDEGLSLSCDSLAKMQCLVLVATALLDQAKQEEREEKLPPLTGVITAGKLTPIYCPHLRNLELFADGWAGNCAITNKPCENIQTALFSEYAGCLHFRGEQVKRHLATRPSPFGEHSED